MTELSKLTLNDNDVSTLQDFLHKGTQGISSVPDLVKAVINLGSWRERVVQRTGEIVRFKSFTEFITTDWPEGLGESIDTLRDIIELSKDKAILQSFDDEVRGQHGGNHGNQYTSGKGYNITLATDSKAKKGTSPEAALRRLRKDRPDVHQRVIAGELSPHAGMIEAGFRKRTAQIPIDPEKAAVTLARHFTPDELRVLVSALAEMIDWK